MKYKAKAVMMNRMSRIMCSISLSFLATDFKSIGASFLSRPQNSPQLAQNAKTGTKLRENATSPRTQASPNSALLILSS